MFTGIVQTVGTILAAAPTGAGRRLTVALGEVGGRGGGGGGGGGVIALGDSVCVSGVCLTVAGLQGGQREAIFDVITETLRRTTLGDKRPGDRVNLELSLRPDSFVGGHFVQGHVDALARVTAVQARPEDWRITFQPAAETMAYIVPKGSVAVDGVSMTVAEATAETFTLAVIPTTLERTTLGTLHVGDAVNVETDILARTVVHYLERLGAGGARGAARGMKAESSPPIENATGGISLAKLIEAGFA